MQSSIANYEETGNASYVTAFNQNFSIIEEKVLQNRISILDSVIYRVCCSRAFIHESTCAVISIAAMASSPIESFNQVYLGAYSTGNSHEINNILQ
ncbi:MAG: hypothetical protein ACLUJR_07705 [Mediterraneibacter gnavus]